VTKGKVSGIRSQALGKALELTTVVGVGSLLSVRLISTVIHEEIEPSNLM